MKELLANYFKSNNDFIHQQYSYEAFYKEILNRKVPNEEIVAIAGDSIDDLISYFAVINAGKIAIMYDPEILTKDEFLKDKYFKDFLNYKDDEHRSFCFYESADKFSYEAQELSLTDTSSIIFTSGSSGRPKAIELSLRSMFSSAKDTIDHYKMNSSDCWAITLPFFHIGGLMIIYRTLLAKASTVLIDPRVIESELLRFNNITIISCVELQLKRILSTQESIRRAKKLKVIVLGGAKTSPVTLKEACQLDIHLSNTYGMSESSSMICATQITKDIKLLESVGSALGNNKIEIINGQVKITSTSIANGISFGHEFHGQLLTQDMGHLENGNLFIEGRKDETIISAGKNISPEQIDQTIREKFKDITYSKTFGIEDSKYGRAVVSVIESDKALDHLDLRKELRSFLPSYMIPKLIIQTKKIETLNSGIKINNQKLLELSKFLFSINSLLKTPLIRGNLAAQPLIIFHGFMGSYKDFKFLLPILEEHYLLILVNLPGHHNQEIADSVKHNGFEDYCHNISRLLAPIKSYSLLGYSLGARVCSVLSTISTNIDKLVIESGGLGIEDTQERESRKISDSNLLKNIDNQDDLNEFISKWYDLSLFSKIKLSKDYKQISSKSFMDVEGWKYSLDIHGQYQMPRLLPENICKNAKCFYIYGENDAKYELVANRFKTLAQIYKIEKASHNAHITNNTRYIEVIKSIMLK